MSYFEDAICPLCSEICHREELCRHIAVEHERMRQLTIKVIQAYHPEWVAENGACGPCWKSFKEAAQALNLLKDSRRVREYWRVGPHSEDPLKTNGDSRRRF